MAAGYTRAVLSEELRVDLVAKRYLGTERDGMTEALLLANPGLSASAYVPAGTTIVIPEVTPAPPAAAIVNPWD